MRNRRSGTGRSRRGLSIFRSVRAQPIALGVFALILGTALVLLRGEPFVASDQGVFLSVAGRLLDGDRLYAEVFDNKDPLFFYSYAGALWAAGWRGPFLLDAVWLGVGAVSIGLLLRELRAPRAATLASFLVYPLTLTAEWYLVGLSMLGALSVAPLVPWLWLRGWHAASGAAVVFAMLLKLNLAPVVAAPVAALIAFRMPDAPRWHSVKRGMLGAAGAVVAAVAVLGVRGELRSYLETFAYNVHYAGARTQSEGFLGRAHDHLRILTDFFHLAGKWQLPAAILLLVAFTAVGGVALARGLHAERALVGMATATLVAAVGVIALTAYGDEHLQVLAYPVTLITGALVWRTNAMLGRRWCAVAACGVVLFALWSSLKVAGGRDVSTLWTARPISPGAIALERARGRFIPTQRTVGYMVIGSNSEGGHAAFIDDSFDLECRYFHLYLFSVREQFDETLSCAERERPTFVLVTLGFFDEYGDVPAWNAFVAGAKRLLDRRYEYVEEEYPGVQVWKLRSA